MKKSNRKFILAVLIPAFIEVMIFMVIPIIGTFGISFLDYSPLRNTNDFVGLQNYQKLLTDDVFFTSLKNTLIFTFAAVILNIIISLGLATMISQLKSNKTRSFFRMMSFLPCIAPMVASSVVWSRTIFQTRGGLINALIQTFGGSPVAWLADAKYLMISVIIFTLWADVGYNTILFCAGIDGIPRDVYEASNLDGANRWATFTKITLPLLGRTMTFVVLMTLISYFQMFAQFDILALNGGPQSSGLVLTSYIYKTAFKYKEMGYAAAISMALFVIILIVSLIEKKFNKIDWEY